MRWLGVSPLPPGWDASPSQSYPPPFHQASLTICGYPFILLVERSTVRVESFTQKHNTMTQPGLEFGHLYLESGAPTIRPTCLPPLLIKCTCVISFVVISIVCSSSTLSSRVGLFRWRSWRVASSCTDGKNKRLYSQDISQANWKAQSKNNPLIFRPFFKVFRSSWILACGHFQKWPKNQGIVLALSPPIGNGKINLRQPWNSVPELGRILAYIVANNSAATVLCSHYQMLLVTQMTSLNN